MDKNIIRVSKDSENPYVMMNKLFLSETKLSWKAKGVLSYLLSKPDDWKVIIESLIKQSTDGECSTRSALKELKEFNYLQRYPVFIDKVIDHWESVVYEMPNQKQKIKSIFMLENGEELVNFVDNHAQSEETSLLGGNLDVGNLDVGNQRLLINDLTNKELTNKDNTNIIIPFSEIIDYLNLKAETKFRSSSKATRDLITARFNEANPPYTLDDFKTVIDNKVAEWNCEPLPNHEDMRIYLRPQTLFSNKFEGYLNQKVKRVTKVVPINYNKGKNQFVENCPARDYDFKDLEEKLLSGKVEEEEMKVGINMADYL